MKNNRYKEIRTLTIEDLRKVCIENNYYTLGTNEEYTKLLKMLNKKIDTETNTIVDINTNTIIKIATDIMKHTDTEKLCKMLDVEIDDIFRMIAYNIMNVCKSFLIKAL